MFGSTFPAHHTNNNNKVNIFVVVILFLFLSSSSLLFVLHQLIYLLHFTIFVCWVCFVVRISNLDIVESKIIIDFDFRCALCNGDVDHLENCYSKIIQLCISYSIVLLVSFRIQHKSNNSMQTVTCTLQSSLFLFSFHSTNKRVHNYFDKQTIMRTNRMKFYEVKAIIFRFARQWTMTLIIILFSFVKRREYCFPFHFIIFFGFVEEQERQIVAKSVYFFCLQANENEDCIRIKWKKLWK